MTLEGKIPTQEEIDNNLFNRTSKLLPVTLNPSRIIHEHVATYMRSRVQLSCILKSFIDENCFPESYFSNRPLMVSPDDSGGILLVDFLNEIYSKRIEYKNKIKLGTGAEHGVFERYSIRLCEGWNAWLNPLKKGQGKNIIEMMDMLKSADDTDERGTHLIEAKYTPKLMFKICPGPMALQVFTLWADNKKRQDGAKRELTLSDLINHFGYYGIDFQDQPDGLAILMDRMKKLGLLSGNPDAGISAIIQNPYKKILKIVSSS
jgi:hypothetical protein